MSAILDTGAQVTVVSDAFVRRHLAGLKFSGAYKLNGFKSDAPVTASQSEEVEFTIGDSSSPRKFLKDAITDNCILGLDFIAHFKLDIKLSENTLVLDNSTIPIQVSAMPAKVSYTVNTVSLLKKVKILPYPGLNFPLRLNTKFLNDAKFLLFEPVEHLSVDILSVLTLPGSDLPVTILNHTANTVTLKNGFVLGVVSEVSDTNLATDGMQRPAFEIRTLYADQFCDCFPVVKSEDFRKLQLTLPEHIQNLFQRSCMHISLYHTVQLANLLTEFALKFSKGDLDLGHFKGVYHRIITRNTELLKQHLRQAPIHFEQEEEACVLSAQKGWKRVLLH